MDFDYLSRIKELVSLDTLRLSAHLPDGDYRSVYRSRSLDFDELGEYRQGDEVHDIDWKASSRSGKLLVRRYIAEKRHRVLFIGDAGAKMLGHTPTGEVKQNLAITSLGVLIRLFSSLGVDYDLLTSRKGLLQHSGFRRSDEYMLTLLRRYEEALPQADARPLSELLNYVSTNFSSELIIVILTDAEGLTGLSDTLLKRLAFRHDLMFVEFTDVPLSEAGVYDLASDRYADSFLLEGNFLYDLEKQIRSERAEALNTKLAHLHAAYAQVSSDNDLPDCIADLFQTLYPRKF